MPSVYVETTIPSYLTAAPSRNLVMAGRQQVTRDWWQNAQERFKLYVSEAVLQEIRAGDSAAAAKRIELVSGLTVLDLTKEVDSLVEIYQRHFGLPQRAHSSPPHGGEPYPQPIHAVALHSRGVAGASRTRRRHPMTDDPIVDEIRRIRDRMLAECGGDFEKYMDRIREAQKQDHHRLVTKEDILKQKPETKEK